MADIKRHDYDDRAQLAEGLATGIAGILSGAIAVRGSATLAVSGGATPKQFFGVLSQMDLDWSKVTIILVDERIAAPDSERANAKMVREYLLQNRAAAANFIPYDVDQATPEECAAASDQKFGAIADQIDAAILGMGTDGHTASFFPGGDYLFSALDLSDDRNVISMKAAGAGEPRLTLTLPCLLDAGFVALHIEGAQKKQVFDVAMEDRDTMEMPVRAVLHQKVAPIHVFWAP